MADDFWTNLVNSNQITIETDGGGGNGIVNVQDVLDGSVTGTVQFITNFTVVTGYDTLLSGPHNQYPDSPTPGVLGLTIQPFGLGDFRFFPDPADPTAEAAYESQYPSFGGKAIFYQNEIIGTSRYVTICVNLGFRGGTAGNLILWEEDEMGDYIGSGSPDYTKLVEIDSEGNIIAPSDDAKSYVDSSYPDI